MIDNNSAMPIPRFHCCFGAFYGINVLENHYIAAMVNCPCAARFGRARRGGGLAKLGDQVRSSDVTFWGVFALIAWATAMLGANVSSWLPAGLLGGLHASYLDGGSLNQLRGDLAALQQETAKLKQENSTLQQRFALTEQSTGSMTRRVGALEVTIPRLLEASAAATDVDRGAVTASTGTPIMGNGGTVHYTTIPLPGEIAPASPVDAQPMPQPLAEITPDSNAFGIAVGPPIEAVGGDAAWQSINAKAGALLLGLAPILGPVEGGPGKRLVVGPIATEAEARQLCGHLAKIGVACASVRFIGDPLPG
jgi:hypothetical protein